MNTQMTIGTLAREADVGVETIRYYQKRGLLPVAAQRHGAFRVYGETELKRLRFIRRAQALGFSLNEIAGLLDLDDISDREQARKLAIDKIADIDARLDELRSMKTALQTLVRCCEHSSAATPCPILEAFASDPQPEKTARV